MKAILYSLLFLNTAYAVTDTAPATQSKEIAPTSEEIFYSGDQVNPDVFEERQEEEETPVEYPYDDGAAKEEQEYLKQTEEGSF